MSRVHVRVTGNPALRDRVAALDGISVVDADPDCVVTNDLTETDAPEPTVVVTDGIADIDGSFAGLVPPDAPDTQLADQLRLVANAELARARSKAEHLHDITREIVACDDPDEVYQLAAEAAARVLEFDISYVAEAGETYFVPKAMSDGMVEDGYTHEMRIDEGIAGRTYQSGESVLIDDVTDFDGAKPVDPDYRAALSVPIGDIGVFQAVSTTPGVFDEHDRELVELLMSHVAETIARLRTEARLRDERRTIEQLHESTTELISCETETELCERIVTAAEGVLEFEVCAVLLADDEDGPLELVAASDSPLAPEPCSTVTPTEGIAGRTFREEEVIQVTDVADAPDAQPHAEAYQSALSLPLGSVGVVQAIAAEPNAFDDRDRELAELFVSQAAAVLARLRAERELVTERDRLEEFASVLSHDLRNPLSVATGSLELAMATGDETHLDRVATSLDRMDALVDDVLTLAREPCVDETSPTDIADHARTAARTVDLDDLQVADGLPTVEADPDALLRLLENLLRNAVEHGSTGSQNAPRSGDAVEHGSTSPRSQAREDAVEHAGPDVTVRVVPLIEDGRGGPTGFAVADDGPGIPPVEREQVFDSGYTTGDGTGLGLAIVRSVAEAHGWSVSVTESDSGGARFEIRTA